MPHHTKPTQRERTARCATLKMLKSLSHKRRKLFYHLLFLFFFSSFVPRIVPRLLRVCGGTSENWVLPPLCLSPPPPRRTRKKKTIRGTLTPRLNLFTPKAHTHATPAYKRSKPLHLPHISSVETRYSLASFSAL